MSIINDALRKASRQKATIAPKDKTADNSPLTHWPRQKQAGLLRGRYFWVFLAVLLVAGPLLVPAVSSWVNASKGVFAPASEKGPQTAAVAQNTGSGETRKAQFAVEQLPLFGPVRPGAGGSAGFELSGIVYSPDGSYGIVNQKVLRVGDEIKGATIQAITASAVVLRHRGKELTLTLED